MIKLNSLYENKAEAKQLIADCEKRFNGEVLRVAEEISRRENVRCLTLAGPSCSGKTTAAARLSAALERNGRRARVVSIDDFYYEEAEMKARGVSDFESADAINIPLFSKTVSNLSKGEASLIPTFDFTDRTRAAYTEYIPTPEDIYIFEGIQAVYPEVTAALEPFETKSIFICVNDALDICGTVFEKEEIRLVRRVVRDIRHRNTSPEMTMRLWSDVRQNEERNIFPFAVGQDYSINSLLEYELFLLCPFFLSATEPYPENVCGAKEIFSLRERLKGLLKSAVCPDLVPLSSVIREFAE